MVLLLTNTLKASMILQLVEEIDLKEMCGGLVPISSVYNRIRDLSFSIANLHEILISMETMEEKTIYLEPINDPSRLSKVESLTVIIDSVRGSLYYIGRW